MTHQVFQPVHAPRPRSETAEAAARAATRHMLELGLRRVGFVGGEEQDEFTAARLAGFLAAHAECGRAVEPDHVVLDVQSVSAARYAEQALLARANSPDAVFVGLESDDDDETARLPAHPVAHITAGFRDRRALARAATEPSATNSSSSVLHIDLTSVLTSTTQPGG